MGKDNKQNYLYGQYDYQWNSLRFEEYLSIVDVCNFVSPVVGIADEGSLIPHSFMFLHHHIKNGQIVLSDATTIVGTKDSDNSNNWDDSDDNDHND